MGFSIDRSRSVSGWRLTSLCGRGGMAVEFLILTTSLSAGAMRRDPLVRPDPIVDFKVP
jgi:hypothetical protein